VAAVDPKLNPLPPTAGAGAAGAGAPKLNAIVYWTEVYYERRGSNRAMVKKGTIKGEQ